MQIRSKGWEDPLKKEMTTLSNILAQKIPWTEELGGAMGLQRVGQLSAAAAADPELTGGEAPT